MENNIFDYDKFHREFVIDVIKKEINLYEKSAYHEIEIFSQYICYLKNRIGEGVRTKDSKYKYPLNKLEYKKMNLEEYSKDIDVIIYDKPWKKLKEFHKIYKIKEFIKGLKYRVKISSDKIEKNREKIEKELISGVKEKRLNRGRINIEYIDMQIKKINILRYDKKKGIYYLDWPDA